MAGEGGQYKNAVAFASKFFNYLTSLPSYRPQNSIWTGVSSLFTNQVERPLNVWCFNKNMFALTLCLIVVGVACLFIIFVLFRPRKNSDEDYFFDEPRVRRLTLVTRPPPRKSNLLMYCLIRGEQDELIQAVQKCSVRHLCEHLPSIDWELAQTQSWLSYYRDAFRETLKERAINNADVAQTIHFLKECGFVRRDVLESISTSSHSTLLFQLLIQNKKAAEKKGYTIVVPPELHVYHPFKTSGEDGQDTSNRITKLVVTHVFKSNAKPLLLSVFYEPVKARGRRASENDNRLRYTQLANSIRHDDNSEDDSDEKKKWW